MQRFPTDHPTLTAHSYRFLHTSIALLLVLGLSACTASQTPGVNIPVTLVIYDSTSEPTATIHPIRTLLLPSPTTTATPDAEETGLQLSVVPASQQPALTSSSPVSTPTPAGEPGKTSDLLFLSGPRLLRWDHVTNFTTGLAENVVDFSPSASGEKIAMLRRQNITANGIQLYNLDILDLKEKQIHTLIENSPPLFQISLSPNGERIAFMAQDGIGQVFVQSTIEGSDPEKIGECWPANEMHCQRLSWSPDGRSMVWSDRTGVWLSSMRDKLSRLVLPNQVEVNDPENLSQQVNVSYADLQWSPVGRFILAQVIPSLEGLRWYGVIDTLNGRLVNIPGSTEYARSCLGTLWNSNGDLLIAHGGNAREQTSPRISHWRVIPTRNDLLVLAENTELQAGSLPPVSDASSYEADYCITSLYQLDPDKYFAQVEATGGDPDPILYQLDLEEGRLQKILQLPEKTSELIWSPDGFGSLVVTLDGEIYFAYMDGARLLPISEVLGAEVREFHWLPPMSRD